MAKTQAQLLALAARAAATRDRAEANYRRAILEANRAGNSYDVIAERLGMSKARVAQIVQAGKRAEL